MKGWREEASALYSLNGEGEVSYNPLVKNTTRFGTHPSGEINRDNPARASSSADTVGLFQASPLTPLPPLNRSHHSIDRPLWRPPLSRSEEGIHENRSPRDHPIKLGIIEFRWLPFPEFDPPAILRNLPDNKTPSSP
jgi:hypothetical protein